MVSFCPSKFIKLLEYAGFTGDRDKGLKDLRAAEKLVDTIRWPVSAAMLLLYHLFLEYVYGLAEPDFELMDRICDKAYVDYKEASTQMLIYCMNSNCKKRCTLERILSNSTCNFSTMPRKVHQIIGMLPGMR